MKKSIYAGAMLAAAALTMAACGQAPGSGGSSSSGGATGTETSASADGGAAATDYTACMVSDEGGFDDASFNQVAHDGLTQAGKELGVQTKQAESSDPSAYVPNIDSMVQAGCNMIVGVGFALADPIQAAAAANTDINFAVVDSTFKEPQKNAKPLVFNTQEAAYLAGYLAAGMSKTGTVATYGGQPFPSVTIFMDGFSDGVKAYNDAKGKDVKLLGWDKEKQTGSFTGDFSNVENGYNTTKQFMQQGADIVMPVAGPVGSGSLKAASEGTDVSVVWVDADGYNQPANAATKGLILTSVVKEMDKAVFEAIKSGTDKSFSSDPYVGTLANEGVGIAPFHDFDSKVPAELKSEIDALKADIIAGKITVESAGATAVK